MKARNNTCTQTLKIYVNTEYGNEATLSGTMEDDIASFSDLTWRQVIEKCLHENITSHSHNLEEWLNENFNISQNQLDMKIDENTSEAYFGDLSYYQDNVTGRNVQAFNLIRELNLFPMDIDGNGSSDGIELIQTTANGPRKIVWIEDHVAADWLIEQAGLKGVQLEIIFT